MLNNTPCNGKTPQRHRLKFNTHTTENPRTRTNACFLIFWPAFAHYTNMIQHHLVTGTVFEIQVIHGHLSVSGHRASWQPANPDDIQAYTIKQPSQLYTHTLCGQDKPMRLNSSRQSLVFAVIFIHILYIILYTYSTFSVTCQTT